MNNITVGIDPAFRKDGFAIAIVDEEKTVSFRKFKNGLLDFIGWLINDCPEDAVIGIENSNLQKAIFKKGSGVSVGKNQAASQYAADLCKFYFEDRVYEWSPKEKGKKPTPFEVKAYCNSNKWTLLKSKLSQDEMDALKIAHLTYHRHRIFKRPKKH